MTITDFVAKAAILSLLEHPAMNSQYHNGVVETFENVHLGIAAALDNGLAVPVIQHAERLTLIELAKGIKLYGKKHVKESFYMTKSKVLPLPSPILERMV